VNIPESLISFVLPSLVIDVFRLTSEADVEGRTPVSQIFFLPSRFLRIFRLTDSFLLTFTRRCLVFLQGIRVLLAWSPIPSYPPKKTWGAASLTKGLDFFLSVVDQGGPFPLGVSQLSLTPVFRMILLFSAVTQA